MKDVMKKNNGRISLSFDYCISVEHDPTITEPILLKSAPNSPSLVKRLQEEESLKMPLSSGTEESLLRDLQAFVEDDSLKSGTMEDNSSRTENSN